jgi:PAS domain S-box-containing protein
MISFTETSRLKSELDTRPEEFRNIIQTTELGICITDKDGNYVAVNAPYCAIYGYSSDELIGKHFSIVVPEANVAQLSALHDSFIKNKMEILRKWQVKQKSGNVISIFVDTHYSESLIGQPTKITFISPV